MTTLFPPQCRACIRLLSIEDSEAGEPATCSAYLDGIPPAIWENRADHRRPYRGDNGLRFEQNSTVADFPFDLFRVGVATDEQ